ncbi:UDP-N-acetylmuramate dehydrogenase [bacterium]|nr:UDP-N-acetylmuramate dehydrogenase [bacterium]
MENIFEKLKNFIPEIKENVSLKSYCTFRIGGSARFLLETGNYEMVIKAISFCNENNIPFYIIGGGSNLLISDKGFDGLVIIYRKKFNEIKISKECFNKIDDDKYEVNIESAMFLSDAVAQVSSLGFTGFEWAAGIPGTVAGAINGNAGAFDGAISDCIIDVKALQVFDKKIEIKIIEKNNCNFSYRSSLFKENNEYIIISAAFAFKKNNTENIKNKIQENIKRRAGKHPKGFSAGSIFKNYEGIIDNKLFKKYPELEKFQERGVVPIGYLVEKCNLKGTRIGDAKISDEHGNFIINLGQAKSDNILKLIVLVKKEVKSRFGIDIREEIKYLG